MALLIYERPVIRIFSENHYHDLGFSWCTSVPPGTHRDTTWNLKASAFVHVVSKSIFT